MRYLPLVLMLTAGCASTLANTTSAVADRHILPATLRGSDATLGCAAGEALSAIMGGFGGHSANAAQTNIVPMLAAGICLEQDIWQAEFRRLRAHRAGEVEEATDARIEEQRLHRLAAARYLASYDLVVDTWGLPAADGQCPTLRHERDEFYYLMGLCAGMMASIHNSKAQGAAGDTGHLPPTILRASTCVDDQEWWGVPLALRAAISTALPGQATVDAWKMFDDAASIGEAAGVRLAGAFLVQAAANTGDDARRADSLRRFAASLATPADPRWAMLDDVGRMLAMHESDVLWTEAEGHRTPYGELGRLPSTAEAALPDAGDLLEGLDL